MRPVREPSVPRPSSAQPPRTCGVILKLRRASFDEKELEAIDEGSFPTMEFRAVQRHFVALIQVSDALLFMVGFQYGGEPNVRPSSAPAVSASSASSRRSTIQCIGNARYSRWGVIAILIRRRINFSAKRNLMPTAASTNILERR
jgi:hypothetical protein